MKFAFRFQKILDFKISQEEVAQQKLAEWVRKYNDSLEQVAQIKTSQQQLRELVLSSSGMLTGLSSQIDNLNQYKSKLDLYVKEIEEPLKQAREEYFNAKREKETFELLKNKEYEKFLYNEKKKQQQILDEYGRNTYLVNQQEKANQTNFS